MNRKEVILELYQHPLIKDLVDNEIMSYKDLIEYVLLEQDGVEVNDSEPDSGFFQKVKNKLDSITKKSIEFANNVPSVNAIRRELEIGKAYDAAADLSDRHYIFRLVIPSTLALGLSMKIYKIIDKIVDDLEMKKADGEGYTFEPNVLPKEAEARASAGVTYENDELWQKSPGYAKWKEEWLKVDKENSQMKAIARALGEYEEIISKHINRDGTEGSLGAKSLKGFQEVFSEDVNVLAKNVFEVTDESFGGGNMDNLEGLVAIYDGKEVPFEKLYNRLEAKFPDLVSSNPSTIPTTKINQLNDAVVAALEGNDIPNFDPVKYGPYTISPSVLNELVAYIRNVNKMKSRLISLKKQYLGPLIKSRQEDEVQPETPSDTADTQEPADTPVPEESPEEKGEIKKSSIRNAFEEYFKYIEDATAYLDNIVKEESKDIIEKIKKAFTERITNAEKILKDTEGKDRSEKLKNLDDAGLDKAEKRIKKLLSDLGRTFTDQSAEEIRQKILQDVDIPESIKKLYPDMIPSLDPTEEEPTEAEPEAVEVNLGEFTEEQLAKVKEIRDNNKEIYDAFKKFLDGEVVPDNLLSETKEYDTIEAIEQEFDNIKNKFKSANQNERKRMAQSFIRLYDEIVQLSDGPEETKDKEIIAKPTQLSTFVQRHYSFGLLQQKIKELSAEQYKVIMILYIIFKGSTKKLKESKYLEFDGFDLEFMKNIRAIPNYKDNYYSIETAALETLSKAEIKKIIVEIDKIYRQYPFEYTGTLDNTFFATFSMDPDYLEKDGEEEIPVVSVEEDPTDLWADKNLDEKESEVLQKFLDLLESNTITEIDSTDLEKAGITEEQLQKAYAGLSDEEKSILKGALEKFASVEELGVKVKKQTPDDEKEEIELNNLQQVVTFLWNKSGSDRVKYREEIAKALKDFGPIYHQVSKKQTSTKVGLIESSGEFSISFQEKTEDTTGRVFIQEIGQYDLRSSKEVKTMLKRLHDDEDKHLIDFVPRSGGLVRRILKKIFDSDAPIDEQIQKKLKPFIEEVFEESYG